MSVYTIQLKESIKEKMQASIYYSPQSAAVIFPKTSTFPNTLLCPVKQHHQRFKTSRASASIKAAAGSEIDYNSMDSSVFPAEACETLGGVACDVEMFPETKLKQQPMSTPVTSQTPVDREYLQYEDNPKTVFIEEACDDLGGEFCEPAYKTGEK